MNCLQVKEAFKSMCCKNESTAVSMLPGNRTCTEVKKMYQFYDCCKYSSNAVDLQVPHICSVNGVETRTVFAEPWKTTKLSISSSCISVMNNKQACWTIDFIPNESYLHPIPPRMSSTDVHVTKCVMGTTLDHMFTFPGDYRVCVGGFSCTIVHNRYVHRHVMDLTQSEFDDYANAFNIMRRTTTVAGRRLYGSKCLGSDSEFYTHDTFVSLHTNMASDREHDRLHYMTMQEPAHLSWTMMMQKSLRCICPSCSHPYFNPIRDYEDYYNGTLTSLLASPVWGDQRYGGASNYDKSNTDPFYISDGKFSSFPITQTKNESHWCDDLEELSSPYVKNTCYVSAQLRKGATSVGITTMTPKPVSHLQEVSRRPLYYMKKDDDFCVRYIETMRDSQSIVTDALSLQSMWAYVSTTVHSYGHECISGKWTNDSRSIGTYSNALGENTVVFGNDRSINVGMWYNESIDEHPCIKCYDNHCECTSDCRTAQRWFYEYPNDRSDTGSTYRRAADYSLTALVAGGCDWPKSGTFDWSASANQDPAFYMWHFFTFYQNDLGYQSLKRNMGKSVIELAEEYEQITVHERPGNRLGDATYFRNMIPYLKGQEEGSYHTWHDILAFQTSYQEFVFE
tara:strand:- start:28183 stop:30051 length:1869 start_codon:yes stop_codon:yes gene_type:complete